MYIKKHTVQHMNIISVFFAKIAPEGRENFLGRKNCHFRKNAKKTLGLSIERSHQIETSNDLEPKLI